MKILALDPSLTAWGYCVIDNGKVLDHGCIKTSPMQGKLVFESNQMRAMILAKKVVQLIKDHKIKSIVAETAMGSKSNVAARALYICFGLVAGIGEATGIPWKLYLAPHIRKGTLGVSSASKEDIQEWVFKKYPTLGVDVKDSPKYYKEAVADAALVGAYASKR